MLGGGQIKPEAGKREGNKMLPELRSVVITQILALAVNSGAHWCNIRVNTPGDSQQDIIAPPRRKGSLMIPALFLIKGVR